MTHRLITEWSTDDPQLADTLTLIARYPEHSIERLELEAALHTWQAAHCQRQIGRITQFQSTHRGGGRRAVKP